MFSLIIYESDIYGIYLYTKDPYEVKYQFLINKEKISLEHFIYRKGFIEQFNNM